MTPQASRLADITERIRRAAGRGDTARATELLDQGARVDPADRPTLWALARVAQDEANRLPDKQRGALYRKSADLIRRYRDASKELSDTDRQVLGVVLYNEGCTFALEGETEKAFHSLADAADTGFVTEEALLGDKDLDGLRGLPRFPDLKRRAAEKTMEYAVLRARQMLAQSQPFSLAVEMTDLQGKKVVRDNFQGKVTILNVWGTWCSACRLELPSLAALHARYHARGLEILGLGYERVPPAEVAATVRAFAEKHRIPYPCLIGEESTLDRIPGFRGYPTTLFLDRSGRVRVKLDGFDPALSSDLEAIVRLLLDERPATPAVKR